MSRFIQLHLLTAYPPANLNRDDQGSPKTAKIGGYDRLRVSSQCLKRTWRTSEIFEFAIAKGIRTKMIGVNAFEKLSKFPALTKTEGETIAKNIAKVFGSLKGDSLELDTLAFISDSERTNIDKVISSFRNGFGSATVESNAIGVKLFKVLSSDIQAPIEALVRILKGENEFALLKADWDKPKGLKEIIKNKKFKTSEDKDPHDYLYRMIDKKDEWLEEISGEQKVPNEHLELFFADEYVKLTKEILKKLSLGALLTAKTAKDTEYGVIKHKNHIKLCEGWESQINSWIEKVRASEDDDYTSDDNIQSLKLVVSPGAIPKSAILTNEHTNADIALFGRMLASSTEHKIEAACQVAHAFSVHPTVIEDDYFTAVEEMNQYREDAGAAHIGETRFAAGLFYSYICINMELLIRNLINNFSENVDINDAKYDDERKLANKAISALTEAVDWLPN
ncbi:MAG: CRISPR system Cascade subunit CasC [Desulfobacteraceae bacterium Eth-SRB2]|nr:MAG: CRISPR system Cascade subunit CasC [Desulfobacteraceae bacterium Eth-SRB2]